MPQVRLLQRRSVFASYLIWPRYWLCRRTQWSRCRTGQSCCWRPSLHGLHRLCVGHVKFGVGLHQGSNNSSSSTCWGQVNNSNIFGFLGVGGQSERRWMRDFTWHTERQTYDSWLMKGWLRSKLLQLPVSTKQTVDVQSKSHVSSVEVEFCGSRSWAGARRTHTHARTHRVSRSDCRGFNNSHLILQMQSRVISFYGVTSRIRFTFLLFPQISQTWRYESEPPLKP